MMWIGSCNKLLLKVGFYEINKRECKYWFTVIFFPIRFSELRLHMKCIIISRCQISTEKAVNVKYKAVGSTNESDALYS